MRTLFVIVSLCLFAAYSGVLKTELSREKSPVAKLKIGEPMPDFELPGLDGKMVKLSEMIRGKKLVVINFWATWCGPCRIEMPSFEQIYRKHKDNGFVILAIAEDQKRAKLDDYLSEKPVTFPVLVDEGGLVAKKFNIENFPTTIQVAGDGTIQEVHEGVHSYLKYSVERTLNHPERR